MGLFSSAGAKSCRDLAFLYIEEEAEAYLLIFKRPYFLLGLALVFIDMVVEVC
jgi:hypothetical protein